MKRMFTIALMFFSLGVNAWTILGTPPPATHTVQVGTLKAYASVLGAKRYYFINDGTICNAIPTPLTTSTTYTIPLAGLYKNYLSPTGVLSRYPVSFAEECKAIVPLPVSTPTNPPIETGRLFFTGKYFYHKSWGDIIYPKENTVYQCPAFKIVDVN